MSDGVQQYSVFLVLVVHSAPLLAADLPVTLHFIYLAILISCMRARVTSHADFHFHMGFKSLDSSECMYLNRDQY